MINQEKAILEELSTKIWKTKGSRFNASRRLQSRKTWGGYLVSAYSIYILAISIFLLTKTNFDSQILNFSSIIGSLLILVFSLHEGSMNAEQKAERHHVCAKELTALYTIINIRTQENKSLDAVALSNEYASIIDRCAENHEPIDYEMFKTEHKEFKISCTQKAWINFEYSAFKTICLLMIIAPPAILIVHLLP